MPRIRATSIAEHKKRTRREILDAAVEVFSDLGYADASLGDIAALVGIGRTTMYEYFSDKEALLVAVVEDSLPRLLDEMIASIPDGLSATERLAEFIVRSLEFVADDHNMGTLIMREVPKLTRAAQDRVRRVHERLRQELVAICEAGVEGGEFRAIDPDRVSDLVNATTMEASRTLLRSEDPKQHVHQMADDLVSLLLHGLLVRSAGGR